MVVLYAFFLAMVVPIQLYAQESCPTETLKPLVGSYSGFASIVTFKKGQFSLRRPKSFAPKSIANQSNFDLDPGDPCHKFHVKIEYFKPEWVAEITGKRTVRTVQFDGESAGQLDLFTLSTDGVPKGQLHVIDEKTFMATFDAPNPLNPEQLTACKEFISLTSDGRKIVRTIQCFDKQTGDFVQDRLTMENFK
jgi:hypothetical protein